MLRYTYDALNRLTAIHFPDSSEDITFSYDSLSVSYGMGRPTGMADPSGTYTFHYDPQGNLVREEKKINEITYTTQYGYDRNNTLESITYPSGRTVTYELDKAGRILQVTTPLNGQSKTLASDIGYLPYGGSTGLTYGNGLTLSHGYDQRYQTGSIQTGSVMNLTYSQDPSGNITSISDLSDPTRSQTFGYDALNRLVSATGVYGQISYTYDPVGNRMGRTVDDKTETYTYEPGTNRLVQIEGETPRAFSSDPNGNTVSENDRTYLYDSKNRLSGVSESGTKLADYLYNGSGQRIKKTTQNETRLFHYDLYGHLIAETGEDGETLAEYVYLEDRPLAMIREEKKEPEPCFLTKVSQVNAETEEVAYYFHNDHLGTPQAVTDREGLVVWKADYRPFGKVEILVEEVDNPFRFPGQYFDQETGLHYNYFRDYYPGVGRYLEPDPIGLVGGIGLFIYAMTNPVVYADEEGLKVFYHAYVVNKEMRSHLENLSNFSGYDVHLTSGTRNKPGENPKSQHFTGNAADFHMTTSGGRMVDMKEAAYRTADYGGFTGIGYYSGDGPHGAHIHADLRSGRKLYWSETDDTGYHYNANSLFWRTYFELRNKPLYYCK